VRTGTMAAAVPRVGLNPLSDRGKHRSSRTSATSLHSAAQAKAARVVIGKARTSNMPSLRAFPYNIHPKTSIYTPPLLRRIRHVASGYAEAETFANLESAPSSCGVARSGWNSLLKMRARRLLLPTCAVSQHAGCSSTHATFPRASHPQEAVSVAANLSTRIVHAIERVPLLVQAPNLLEHVLQLFHLRCGAT